MDDFWLLYLLTRVDAVKVFLGVVLFCGTMVVIIGGAVGFPLFAIVHDDSAFDRARAIFKTWWPRAVVIPALASILNLAAPTKTDLLFIYGGSAILEAVKSPRAQSIGEKTLSAVEKWIDENTKEVGK